MRKLIRTIDTSATSLLTEEVITIGAPRRPRRIYAVRTGFDRGAYKGGLQWWPLAQEGAEEAARAAFDRG